MKSPLLPSDGLPRCAWSGQDPLYLAYHDTEWGVPEYDDRALYEKLVLDGFQAGLSWITILRKRENFRRAFDAFEPAKIARYTPRKIEKLMQDTGIVRNRMKIEGAVLSGRRLDLLDPSALDIEIADIAHGLARVARWNGQTEGAHIFSVAQHSLLVEAIARQRARFDRAGRLAVLLHDAPEYVIGDMISPFKAVIGNAYKTIEARLLAAIHVRFGLPAALPADLLDVIKTCD